MEMIIKSMPTWKLLALKRVAKTKAYAFFRDPRIMRELRRELERRTWLMIDTSTDG